MLAAALAFWLAVPALAVELTPYQGKLPPVAKSSMRVFRDKAEWEDFWREAQAAPGGCPRAVKPTAPPEIDFERYELVAVFAGRKSTTGHSIRIESIEDLPKRRLAHAVARSVRGFVGMLVTCPAHAVLAPKSALPVEFDVTVSSAAKAAAPKR